MPDTGFKNPASAASIDTSGELDWTNPGNIFSEDSSYASSHVSQLGTTDILYASNFGIVIPTHETLTGIEIFVVWNSSKTDVFILSAITLNGTEAATQYTVTPNSTSVGGPNATWGLGSLFTEAAVEATTFGVWMQGTGPDLGDDTINVDHIKIKIYYTVMITDAPEKYQYVTSGRRW